MRYIFGFSSCQRLININTFSTFGKKQYVKKRLQESDTILKYIFLLANDEKKNVIKLIDLFIFI